MKRFKLFTLILAAFALLAAVPAQAALQDMWAYVYKWDGKMSSDGKPVLTRLTSGVTFKVLAQNSDTAETLYYYKGSTALTNPVTTTNFAANTVCNDQVRFRVDPTDTTYDRYVDLIVVDTNGASPPSWRTSTSTRTASSSTNGRTSCTTGSSGSTRRRPTKPTRALTSWPTR